MPYPDDYGGVIPIFHTIVALHAEGIGLHLHCFEYGRGVQPELEKYCVSVNYYPRRSGHKGFSHTLPYIVASRVNEDLFNNLLLDHHPILLEGIHCSYLLHDDRFRDRKILLRLHNVEYLYYRQLFQCSRQPLRKIYYYHESRLLKKYEAAIAKKTTMLAFADQDAHTYTRELSAPNVRILPLFLPFQEVSSREGIGCFCLYHGNLSVPENEKAVSWLVKEVFNDLPFPLVIAGKNPSAQLENFSVRHKNTCIVANPSHTEMQDMIGKAQINILPSFGYTGMKLKLLNALFNGRHCLVNPATVENTALETACHIGNNAVAFKSIITQLYRKPFTEEEITLRKKLLEQKFDNACNAERLIRWIW